MPNPFILLLLFVYALIQTLFPIPVLEVVYVPMIVVGNHQVILLSGIGTLGGLLGDIFGYTISYFFGRCMLPSLIHDDELVYGQEMMKRYGSWSILMGSITTIPAFLIPYLAGLVKMNIFVFLGLSTTGRFIRSVAIGYGIVFMKSLINAMVGNQITICLMLVFISWVIIERIMKLKKPKQSKQ